MEALKDLRIRNAIVILSMCAGTAGLAVAGAPSTDLVAKIQEGLSGNAHGTVCEALQGDPDRDGRIETVAITFKTLDGGHRMGGEIVVLRPGKKGIVPVWRERNMNPWKLRVADVDGDKKPEIIVGVWKKSPKDPVMAKRVFVWSWNGERMLPKWLGSRLSRRFEDFDVRDIDGDGWAELLALEVAPGKPKRIGIYRWRSFGFDWLGSAEPGKWKELTK